MAHPVDMRRVLTRIGFSLMRGVWFLARPLTLGVCGIVEYDNKILLVRHSYRSGWYLPGGGVRRGESCQSALQRELREETGLTALDPMEQVAGPCYRIIDYKHDHVMVFRVPRWSGEVDDASNHEIVERKFFALDALPSDLAGIALRIRKENDHWIVVNPTTNT